MEPNLQSLYDQQTEANTFRNAPGVLEFNQSTTEFLNGAAAFEAIPPSAVLQRSVILTSPELLALNDTPVNVIPAPGNGFAINVIGVYLELIFNTTPYTVPALAVLQLGFGGGINIKLNGSGSGFLNGVSGKIDQNESLAEVINAVGSVNNSPVNINLFGASNLTVGDSTVRVTLVYSIVPVSAPPP
jgi:hypothetical protein